MYAPTPLVYLLAPSHSGSTLLALLLARHPELCTIGEMKLGAMGDLERYRCSCQERLRDCRFWARLRAEMASRGFDFDVARAGTDYADGGSAYARRLLRPLHRGRRLEGLRDAALALAPGWSSRLRETHARNAALAASVCALTGSRAIVDSSKQAVRLKYLLRNPGLDVRVIRVVRDARGVALAYIDPARFADARDPRLRDGGAGGGREAERLGTRAAAREWRRSNEEAEALLATLEPARATTVRYEELCRDPHATLRRLFGFLGVDASWDRLDFRAGELHVVGNGMRLDRDDRIELDERWREALSPRDLATIDAEAGAIGRRLGYP